MHSVTLYNLPLNATGLFLLISYSGERCILIFNIQNILQNIQNVLLTVYLKIKQGHNRDVLKKKHMPMVPKPLAFIKNSLVFAQLPEQELEGQNVGAWKEVHALKPAWLQSFLSSSF